jgi:hypothetical protein
MTQTTGNISVTITPPSLDIEEAWNDLLLRADGNVFLSPGVLCAIPDASNVHVLLAWEDGERPRRLLGIWALRNRTPMDRQRQWLAPHSLISASSNASFITNPVIDRNHIEEVIAAFFAAIRDASGLPRLIQLLWFEADTPVYTAMRHQLGRWRYREYERDERPFVNTAIGVKKSGSTRQNLRRHWKRLQALPGGAEISNDRSSPAVIQKAFEIFLNMEQGQWKGAQGTAMLSRPQNAIFARKMVDNLANEGNLSVAVLTVGGEPVATQVLLYCATTAYTWKTAFDSRYSKYSPGTVLVDEITSRLLDSGDVLEINSCARSNSFMAGIWDGRRSIVEDALIDVSRSVSPALVRELITWQLHRFLRRFSMRIWPTVKRVSTRTVIHLGR